jgi:hypothetical protein
MSDLHVQFQILQYAYQRNKHAKGVQADSMTARIEYMSINFSAQLECYAVRQTSCYKSEVSNSLFLSICKFPIFPS